MPPKKIQIVPHKHCIECGGLIVGSPEFCSDVCRQRYIKYERQRRSFRVTGYVLMTVFIIMFLLMGAVLRGD